jgi:hypothetical protein
MILIGSQALKKYLPNITPEDIDVIGERKEILKFVKRKKLTILDRKEWGLVCHDEKDKWDFFYSDQSDSLKLYAKYENDVKGQLKTCSIETLYSLKKSHIHFPIKFQKHIEIYCMLHDMLKVDKLSHITKKFQIETQERINIKLQSPSLNKSVAEFFDQSKDYVKYFFVHDDIHKVMSHYDEPLFLRMQVDKTMAKCEKDMWEKFSFEDKCKCVLEEAYVISLERKIIPILYGKSEKYWSPQEAFEWSLMRICTNLCGGWFREFATNNYMEILKYYNPSYLDKFLIAVTNKNILPID